MADPPQRAVIAYKDEEDWTLIDDTFSFRFSLYPRSFVEVKSTGEIFEGYFGDGSQHWSGEPFAHNSTKTSFRGLGDLVNHEEIQCGPLRCAFRGEIRGPHMAWRGLHISNPARLTPQPTDCRRS
jgi:CRISPR-associated endonuclease Csn1